MAALSSMVSKLTFSKVQQFETKIRRKYPGTVFDLTFTQNLLSENLIELSRLIVQNRKQGVGTSIMREFCEFADRHNVQIKLTPASKGDYEATTSRARLIRFYKRFGFKIGKRKAADLASAPTMTRTLVE
jgi:GNAT superfamily N-acetyltransferase